VTACEVLIVIIGREWLTIQDRTGHRRLDDPGDFVRLELESALARPQQKHTYDPGIDLAGLAAAYAFGLARNHPYRDGNKRIAFLALVTFLGINGREFDASEEDVVATILALADGRLTEDRLADWIRRRLTR